MYEWHDNPPEYSSASILATLKDERIVEIEKTPRGIRFIECCDHYFGCTLSIDQVKTLISELENLCQANPQPKQD